MQSTTPTETTVSSATSVSPVSRSLGLSWVIGMVAAAAAGLAALHFLPWQITIPQSMLDELQGNTMGLSALESEMAPALRWKNNLLRLTLVGVSFGILPMLFVGGRSFVARTLLGLLIGAVCGAGCMMLVNALSTFISGTSWGQTADGSPAMVAEIVLYSVASLVILFPAAIALRFSGIRYASQKSVAIPVAGIIAGLLLPIVATFAFPETGLGSFPPEAASASLIWLALLAGFGSLLPMVTGEPKKSTVAPDDSKA